MFQEETVFGTTAIGHTAIFNKEKNMLELPLGYALLEGEELVATDPKEELPDNYYIGATEPDESEMNAVFVEMDTFWHDITNSVVKTYTGKNSQGKAMWQESENQLKYVLDFENTNLVGKIVKKTTSGVPAANQAYVPPASFEELLDEI